MEDAVLFFQLLDNQMEVSLNQRVLEDQGWLMHSKGHKIDGANRFFTSQNRAAKTC